MSSIHFAGLKLRSALLPGPWLALCLWLSACGRGSAPAGAASPGPPPCGEPDAGSGFAHTLLRVTCDGTLRPGRAGWTTSDGAVTLDFPAETPGPRGSELVALWPPPDQPPWLGHRVRRFVVLQGGNIRVEFDEPAGDAARLFADPRLAGAVTAVRDGDARDAIDANAAAIVTRHDASIGYARSLGRTVRLLAFDRLYLVAFARGADAARAKALMADVGSDWVGMGAAGARRLSALNWEEAGERCEAGVREAGRLLERAEGRPVSGIRVEPPAARHPTVSYREGDISARQIAERLVSAGLREGELSAVVGELTGSEQRMVVRPVARWGAIWTETDVAAVIAVRAGPVHPCSLHAEALRELGGWSGGPARRDAAVLPVGEAAAFAIGSGTERGP